MLDLLQFSIEIHAIFYAQISYVHSLCPHSPKLRPLGAILFGEMGDRMVGRKNALAFSIILITVPSVLLGLLPTYARWGPIAPICLVILRMMQGLSVGGQLAGSYVLSIEQSSSKTRGFRGSVCDASSVSSSVTIKVLPFLFVWFGLLIVFFVLSLLCRWEDSF